MAYDYVIFANMSSDEMMPRHSLKTSKRTNCRTILPIDKTIPNQSRNDYEINIHKKEKPDVRKREDLFTERNNSTFRETFSAVIGLQKLAFENHCDTLLSVFNENCGLLPHLFTTSTQYIKSREKI